MAIIVSEEANLHYLEADSTKLQVILWLLRNNLVITRYIGWLNNLVIIRRTGFIHRNMLGGHFGYPE